MITYMPRGCGYNGCPFGVTGDTSKAKKHRDTICFNNDLLLDRAIRTNCKQSRTPLHPYPCLHVTSSGNEHNPQHF